VCEGDLDQIDLDPLAYLPAAGDRLGHCRPQPLSPVQRERLHGQVPEPRQGGQRAKVGVVGPVGAVRLSECETRYDRARVSPLPAHLDGVAIPGIELVALQDKKGEQCGKSVGKPRYNRDDTIDDDESVHTSTTFHLTRYMRSRPEPNSSTMRSTTNSEKVWQSMCGFRI